MSSISKNGRKTRAIVYGSIAAAILVFRNWVPITHAGWSVSGAAGMCNSGLGMFAQAYSSTFKSECGGYQTAATILLFAFFGALARTAYEIYQYTQALDEDNADGITQAEVDAFIAAEDAARKDKS